MKFNSWMITRTFFLSLAFAFVIYSPRSLAQNQNPGTPTCGKQVFNQKQKKSRWTVHKCDEKGQLKFQVKFFIDASRLQWIDLQADGAEVSKIQYKLLSPSTLAIDLVGKKGGEAFIVRGNPDGRLNALKFPYESKKKNALSIQEKGDLITASTDLQKHKFEITYAGEILRVESTVDRKAAGAKAPVALGSSGQCHLESQSGEVTKVYSLTIDQHEGEITKVSYGGSTTEWDDGKPAYCEFNVTAEDPKAKFTRDGNLTIIRYNQDKGPAVVQVAIEAAGFRVTFENVDQSAHCRPGVQIPREMKVKGRKCLVLFD